MSVTTNQGCRCTVLSLIAELRTSKANDQYLLHLKEEVVRLRELRLCLGREKTRLEGVLLQEALQPLGIRFDSENAARYRVVVSQWNTANATMQETTDRMAACESRYAVKLQKLQQLLDMVSEPVEITFPVITL